MRTGILPEGEGYGHLRMKLFRWSELERLLARHGRMVAASAAGLLPAIRPAEPELRAFLLRLEAEFAGEPGAISCGQHTIATVEIA